MSSIVSEILTHFETVIEAQIPSIKKSRHYYGTGKTDDINNGHTYAIRPGSGSPVSGTLRSVTLEQDFELEITKEYIEKGVNDSSLRAAIETLIANHELVLASIPFHTITAVKKINHPSFSAPEVDAEKKSVSITFTYPITYSKSISGS